MNSPNGSDIPETGLAGGWDALRALAAWYRDYAEQADSPVIWDYRLSTAEDLERRASTLDMRVTTSQTVSGVQTIASLMSQLQSAGLADKVTFMTLDVFGRTVGPGNTDGRQHNPNHQVSVTIGKPFKGGVIGGVTPLGGDYGCLNIDPSTGQGTQNTSGSIVAAVDTLGAFGQTMLAAVGTPSSALSQQVTVGTVINAALSS